MNTAAGIRNPAPGASGPKTAPDTTRRMPQSARWRLSEGCSEPHDQLEGW